MRGQLAPAAVPVSRSRAERFDDLVLDAVQELQAHWPELADAEFAVEDIPPGSTDTPRLDTDVVLDRGVALGRLVRSRTVGTTGALLVAYRRPIEARAADGDERGDLVYTVLAELAGELLGRDPGELD